MKIIGIGTDLVQISRIETLLNRYGRKFAARILSEEELKIFDDCVTPANFLAKRFAAKEAVSKGLSVGIGKLLGFTDISVANLPNGQPTITLLGKASYFKETMGVTEIMISLSDEKDYALAFVIILGEQPSIQ